MTSLSISAARKNIDLTQDQMAKKLGVCRETYSNYEKRPDKMPVGTAIRFSQIVGVGIDSLNFLQNKST